MPRSAATLLASLLLTPAVHSLAQPSAPPARVSEAMRVDGVAGDFSDIGDVLDRCAQRHRRLTRRCAAFISDSTTRSGSKWRLSVRARASGFSCSTSAAIPGEP